MVLKKFTKRRDYFLKGNYRKRERERFLIKMIVEEKKIDNENPNCD